MVTYVLLRAAKAIEARLAANRKFTRERLLYHTKYGACRAFLLITLAFSLLKIFVFAKEDRFPKGAPIKIREQIREKRPTAFLEHFFVDRHRGERHSAEA